MMRPACTRPSITASLRSPGDRNARVSRKLLLTLKSAMSSRLSLVPDWSITPNRTFSIFELSTDPNTSNSRAGGTMRDMTMRVSRRIWLNSFRMSARSRELKNPRSMGCS